MSNKMAKKETFKEYQEKEAFKLSEDKRKLLRLEYEEKLNNLYKEQMKERERLRQEYLQNVQDKKQKNKMR
jgi:hypothetical protein